MKVFTRSSYVAAAAVVLGLAGPVAAQAQSNAPAAQPPATQAPGATGGATGAAVSDGQLQTFISAATEVQTISEKWQSKAASSASPEAVEEVRRQATDEMVGAVEAKGMTVDEFNSISQAAQTDPELKARIVAMLEQQQQ